MRGLSKWGNAHRSEVILREGVENNGRLRGDKDGNTQEQPNEPSDLSFHPSAFHFCCSSILAAARHLHPSLALIIRWASPCVPNTGPDQKNSVSQPRPTAHPALQEAKHETSAAHMKQALENFYSSILNLSPQLFFPLLLWSSHILCSRALAFLPLL